MNQKWYNKIFANHYYWLTFFIIVYLILIIPNVLSMRYAAFDYGMYTNAIYDYARWQFNEAPTFDESVYFKNNLLVIDHVDLFLFVIAPFSFLFGFHTLWIVQLCLILLCALGVRKYILLLTKQIWLSNAAMVYFCFHFGVFGALAYDYHGNVVAASFLPWVFIFFITQRKVYLFIVVLFMLLCKENIAIWLFFVGLYLIFNSPTNAHRTTAIMVSLTSLVYFLCIAKFLLPLLNEGKTNFVSFQFKHYGSNFAEMAKHCLLNPLDTIKDIFTNHTNNPLGHHVKFETWLILLVSGGIFIFKSPKSILLFVPLVLQKFLHDREAVWGVYNQYNIEFSVLLSLVLFASYKSEQRWQMFVLILLPCLALMTTLRIMDRTKAWFPKSHIRIYQPGHYNGMHLYTHYRNQLSGINKDEKVCAQNNIQALLSYRDDAFLFPYHIDKSNYLILDTSLNSYPLDKLVYLKTLMSIEQDTMNWKRINNDKTLFIFERKLK